MLKPGGTLAVTVPAWLPEKICWALSDEYHAPFVEGGHVRIYTEAELRDAAARRRPRSPGAPTTPTRCTRPYWWLKCAVGPDQRRPPAGEGLPPAPGVGHRQAQPGSSPAGPSGCSTRCSARASWSTPASPSAEAAVPDAPSPTSPASSPPTELARHGRRASPSGSCPSGMIPWFPGGHADPWNHVEAAMALALGGRRAEAERAYEWLVGLQRPDGAWHQYYLADGVEQDKLDANVVRLRRRRRVAPLAAHRRPRASSRRCGRSSSGPSTSCSTCRRPAARSSGPATPTARRGASPCSPARRRSATACAARSPSPSCSATSAPTGSCRPPGSPTSSAHEPEAFAPKHRWAMDWYYPVLAGVVARRRRPRPPRRALRHLRRWTATACAACRDRPWITVAETCECALAHLAVGERETADDAVRAGRSSSAHDDGRYWTGTVFPDEAHFPGGERSHLHRRRASCSPPTPSPAPPRPRALFVDHGRLPPLIDL